MNSGIEAIYPLSPVQEGILFHTVHSPEMGMYFQQSVWECEDRLNPAMLCQAWQHVVHRHAVLRTGFSWERAAKPLQFVWRRADLPWRELDWTEMAPTTQVKMLGELLRADRERGFSLGRPPLLRVILIQIASGRYRVVWSQHHIILDGWSTTMMLGEVAAACDAFGDGRPLRFGPARPYQDYIAWLEQQNEKAAEVFWRERLKGFAAPTPVTFNNHAGRHPDTASYFGREQIRLRQTVTQRLQSLTRQHHLTLSVLVQAAWSVFLSRYSGATDLVFGATVMGRPPSLAGVESMLGLFINTLPVRVAVEPGASLLPWLEGLHAQQVETQEYEHTPLVKVQGWSDVQRGSPLFESIVVIESYARLDESDANPNALMQVSDEEAYERTNYPLNLVVLPQARLRIDIYYHRSRFDAVTVKRMIGHLGELLTSLSEQLLDRRIADLNALSESERHQVVTEWNATRTGYPGQVSIHQLFALQAGRRPDALALVYEQIHVTYGNLDRLTNRLARYLMARGTGPESVVGILMERGVEMVIGLFGILKCGAAYLPLDPAYPGQRLAFMVEDAGLRDILTIASLESIVPGYSGGKVNLDRDWSRVGCYSDAPVDSGATGENIAYVIYTSGSTGNPKGVMVPHGGIADRLGWIQDRYELTQSDRVLLKTPYSFDISITELFWPLAVGATVVVAKPGGHQDAEYLADLIAEQSVTTAQFVPSLLDLFLAEDRLERCKPLERVFTIGEALSKDLVKRYFGKIGATLHNLYGPTEAAVEVSYWDCEPENDEPAVPIGRPVANAGIYILDRQMEPLCQGMPGEIHLGGIGLARGYISRPELTAEKFVPSPFSIQAPACLYKTGDLGRYLADGRIEFLGRIDHQVKIRGNRVETGEIEAVMRGHAAVGEAVIMARQSRRGDTDLVAYVLANGAGQLSVDDLRDLLRRKLPAYMIPSSFVILDALPLTSNGKIDRKALLAMDTVPPVPVVPRMRPGNEVETAIASIWQSVLKIDQISVTDNFFDLGGHSLLATQVMTRIRGAFQVELPVRTLFELQTISALGAEINDSIRSGAGVNLGEISPRKKDSSLPLSYAQERMWFLDQIDLGSGAYNIGIGVRLLGTIRRNCFAQTVDEVTRRHESLRTRFVVNGGRPEQVVEAGCAGALGLIDLDGLGHLEAGEQIIVLGREIWGRGFDLAQGNLFRLLLIKTPTQGELAIGAMHHIIADGWSVGLLVREMGTLLRSYAAGLPSPLADLRVQYPDYAVWQREWLQGEVLEAEITYWRQQLAGSPPVLELPADRTRPAVQTFRGDRQILRFSPELSAQIKEMCRRHRVTLFMTLLAGFNALLRRHTHSEDIKVGTPIANRNNRQTEDLIGYFANTLVLRTILSADLTFEDLLKQVRETALGAYAHQYLPFEKLVDELQPERDLAYTPLFQVMFTLQNAPVAAVDAGDLKIEPLSFETGTAKFDIELLTEDTPGGLFSALEYNVDLFDAETIRRMGSHFENLIEWMVRNPKGRLSDAGMLSRDEETQLIVQWNRTAVDTSAGESFDQSFEAQVRKLPDAVAAVFQDRQISYEQLNQRAVSIAAALVERGIGRGVAVPLLAERGIEFLTAMLAIFKAGAAYVPLDPDHPWARLRHVINESGNGEPLVLTDGSFAAEPGAAEPGAAEPNATEPGAAESYGGHPDSPVSESDSIVTILMLDDLLNRGSLLAGGGEWVRNRASDIASDLAYVIYTSGSTGVPKGAMVEHGGMLNHLMAKVTDLRLTRADTIAQTASSTFDISVWQFLAALLVGGRCHIFDEFVVRDAMTFFEEVDRAGITILEMVPSLVRPALEQGQGRSGSPALAGLRWLIVTGEAVAPELVSEWSDAYPDVPMMNAYGPTECSDDVTHYAIGAGIPSSGRVPIGRSITNTQLYLLDKAFQIVPIGVNGELFVGGAGVGRGYLRDPGRTAQVFVPDAYSGSEGHRLYKTGDLVRRQTDGNLAYIGRIDHQIKLRGFRIELGEIESALRRDESVKEAVAMVREDEPGRRRLTAYVVPRTGQPVNLAELRARLRETLPDYMLPAAVVVMESLPLTPNGKVDRRALPAPEGSRSEVGASLALPRSSVERTLTEIWRQVLRLDKVGINENFFELGGDSILIIQTISKAKQAGIRLTLRQAFEHQTIAELAAAADLEEMVSAEQGIVTGPVPLTPSQLWLLEQGLVDIDHFNQSVLFEVRERLDPSLVYRVVAALLSHHDALRHRFQGEMGWRQSAEGVDDSIPFSVIDLSGRAAAAIEDEFEAAISELQASLDLAEGPLIRVTLFNLGHGLPDRLSIIIHHLVVDGISWRILLEDFQTAYRQLSRGEEISLPEKTTGYKQWAEHLRRFAGSPELKEEADYWLAESRERIARLPVDFAQGANTQSSAGSVSVALTGEETATLLQVVPKLYQTQINDVLLTALVQAFADWTGKRRLLIDLEGHGRDGLIEGTDVLRTVGWFTAIYPLLLKLEDSIDPGDAMRVIKDRLRRVPNRGIGYGILRYLGTDEAVSTELRNTPRAEVIFNYLGQFNDEADVGSSRVDLQACKLEYSIVSPK